MTNKEMIKMIKDWRGDVCAGVLLKDGVIYLKVVKSDLVFQIENKEEGFFNQMDLSVQNDILYVDTQN